MAILLRRRGLGYTSCRGITEKSERGIRWIRNDNNFPTGHMLCFRWGCTSTIPVQNVVNTARAIHSVNDKINFRRLVDEHNIGSLRTYFSYDDAIEADNFPYILRPRRHSQGKHVYVCENPQELSQAIQRMGHNNFYISPFVDKTAEYRVFIVSGRVVCVANKVPGNSDAVAWNVSQGGRFENVRWGSWNLRAIRIAIEAFNITELDFGGVDVMVDEENNVYILEINSAPSLTSEYRQQCFARAFDYITEHGKQRISLIENLGGWRKFIHPSISEEALLV